MLKRPPEILTSAGENKLLSTDEATRSDASTPWAKTREYAERAEYMYFAPGQATVSAPLALFWLKVAELEAQGMVEPDDADADRSTNE